MSTYKFAVGQTVTIISKDRNLGGKVVVVLSQHNRSLSEDKHDTRAEVAPWYKVGSVAIGGYLSFFEEQLC